MFYVIIRYAGNIMVNVKYTNSQDFRCLEDMSLVSMELDLLHMGKEQCKPYHAISGTRDEYIIHFVVSGTGFYSINGANYPINAGQMFLIYPNTPIVYCADTNNPWSYMWIGFKGLRAEAILKQCGFSKNKPVLPSPDENELNSCFDELFNHIVQDYAGSLYRESILMKLMALLVSTHKQNIKEDGSENSILNKNRHLDAAIDYINTHYMQEISVTDIAAHAGISQGYLNQLFTKHANISIQNYLIDFRMYKAANLLVATDYSIKEISNMVGYRDSLVFSKAFKRKFDMSPKAYRNYKLDMRSLLKPRS